MKIYFPEIKYMKNFFVHVEYSSLQGDTKKLKVYVGC